MWGWGSPWGSPPTFLWGWGWGGDANSIPTVTLCNLDRVLQTYKDNGMIIKAGKCDLFSQEVVFLGHQITPQGIGIVESYIKVINALPAPMTLTEVKSVLGKFGYYSKYIPRYSELAKPLNDLTTKDNFPLKITPNAIKAFEILRDKLIKIPIFAFPNFNKGAGEFFLSTDFSKYAIAAVITQFQEGREKVVIYDSKKFGTRIQVQ